MKKFLLILLLMLSVVIITGSCSSGNQQSTQENDAEQEMQEEADTVETEVRKPVSDVVDGTGLEGTWSGSQEVEGNKNDIILALNSNGTYALWYGDSGDTGASADEFEGTYTDNKTSLNMTPNQVDDAQGFSLGEGEFPYTLNGDSLTIKDSNGQEISFTRDKSE